MSVEIIQQRLLEYKSQTVLEQENALKNVFRTFRTLEDYKTNFSDLWFLSKESFEQGLLLKKMVENNHRLS